ncbi:hypothetical protein AB0K15_46355 [Amycolatopsis sp. NPDC049253]|uniref:hypothetical protein n=1 Tax=Amycolatopsis sp. NPDC049253 TaxID=3155274 RepID=UPI003431580E
MTAVRGRHPSPPQIPLFDHAVRLHGDTPDKPLERGGVPLPDQDLHRVRSQARKSSGWRRKSAEAARILDQHFARPGSSPPDLARSFHGLDVHGPREHISAAALRADEQRVSRTGRWLVRHGTDRCAVFVGLRLLANTISPEDVELLKMIGLLREFGPEAAEALTRRGAITALKWLAERTTEQTRLRAVEGVMRMDKSFEHKWLLRRGLGRDEMSRYLAGDLATQAHLHEAIVRADVPDWLVDETGWFLATMTGAHGVGVVLENYPPGDLVAAAHVRHLSSRKTTKERYYTAAATCAYIHQTDALSRSWSPDARAAVVEAYIAVLARREWVETAHALLRSGHHLAAALTRAVPGELSAKLGWQNP